MPYFRSTAIERAEYDAETATLWLWFVDSGGPYAYRAVPGEVFEALCEAASQGRFYNEHVRDRYEVSPPVSTG